MKELQLLMPVIATGGDINTGGDLGGD